MPAAKKLLLGDVRQPRGGDEERGATTPLAAKRQDLVSCCIQRLNEDGVRARVRVGRRTAQGFGHDPGTHAIVHGTARHAIP